MIDEYIKLTSGDRINPLWLKMKAGCQAELDGLRRQNDGDKDEKLTANLRGRIQQLKQIIALGDEEQQPPRPSGTAP